MCIRNNKRLLFLHKREIFYKKLQIMKLVLLFVEEWCIMYIKLQSGYKIRFSNQKETKINFGLSVLIKEAKNRII